MSLNEINNDDMFKSTYTTVILNIPKSLGKGSGWIIDSVINYKVSNSNHNPLSGSSYIKFPKELDHPKKELINIQNIDDDECFKWCLVRYLNPTDHYPARITKIVKDFAKKLNFIVMKFQVKVREIEKML